MRRFRTLTAALALSLLLTACGQTSPAQSRPSSSSSSASGSVSAVPAEEFVFTRANLPRLDGSTSTVPLAQAMCAVLLGEDQEQTAQLIHFSRTTQSYYNLMNGNADLLLAAEPTPEVMEELDQRNSWYMTPFAIDALVFVVNQNNPVDSLTVDRILISAGEDREAAREKAADLTGEPPVFLNQDMTELDLYGTVDAAVCCLDSLNYLLHPKDVQKCFQRLHLFVAPGGVLVFDINSSAKLAALDGQVFLDEQEDVYCVWRAEFSRRSRICSYFMDIFQLDEATGQWGRGEELHQERAYTHEELTTLLEGAGFQDIKAFGELKLRPPKAGEQRIFYTARKGAGG